MPFGLNNFPTIFSRVVVATFEEHTQKFLEVNFDEWRVFGLLQKHVGSLRHMLETCRQYHISLNIKKSIFSIRSPYFLYLSVYCWDTLCLRKDSWWILLRLLLL